MSNQSLARVLSALVYLPDSLWNPDGSTTPEQIGHNEHSDAHYLREGWELRICSRRSFSEPITMRWFKQGDNPNGHQQLRATFGVSPETIVSLRLVTFVAERSRCFVWRHNLPNKTSYWFFDDCASTLDAKGPSHRATEMRDFILDISTDRLPPFMRPAETPRRRR